MAGKDLIQSEVKAGTNIHQSECLEIRASSVTGRATMPAIAKTLAEAVAAQEDPATDSSAVVAAVAKSATNATKWDTLHVTARRIWTGATAVTEAATSPATVVSHRMTLAATTATRAVIWRATARRRATGT